jgi:hypothetical protein
MHSRRSGRPAFAAAVLLLVLSLVAVLAAPATTAVESDPDAAAAAVEWLRGQQLDSGAFAGFSGEADPASTADAVVAIAATGIDPATISSGAGNDPVSYLTGLAGEAAAAPGSAAKLILALHAAQGDALDPRDVGGVDLVAAIEGGFDAASGAYGQGLFTHALAIMALQVAGEPVEPAAVDFLLNAQIDDGAWNFTADATPGTGDSNSTAMAIQALVAAGAGADSITVGLDYLQTLQAPDGSIAYDGSESPLVGDANSTALAVQAFVAAGRDPSTLPNGDALAALAAFQQPSGALTWRHDFPEDNLLATLQAIPALVLRPLPVSHLGATPEPPSGPNALEEALAPAAGLALDGCNYHLATFHNVCGPFELFWQENGGLKIFGYPLSEPFVQDGVEVQYFERARLEYHPDLWPENHDILLGRLGAEQIGLGGD